MVMASPAISGPGILALMAGGAKTGRRCSRLMKKWPGSEATPYARFAWLGPPDAKDGKSRRPTGEI